MGGDGRRFASRAQLADACRAAGLTFMDGVAAGWGRRELAAWLVGPYREATFDRGLRAKRASASGSQPTIEAVTDGTIADLLRATRWRVFALLEDAARGDLRFVEDLAAAGWVAKHPELGWVAVDVRGGALRQRVLSLFAADYLLRAADYRHKLCACSRCETVVFDERSKRLGHCGPGSAHGPASARRPSVRALEAARPAEPATPEPPPADDGLRLKSDFVTAVTAGRRASNDE
jgi:hypothetical protein